VGSSIDVFPAAGNPGSVIAPSSSVKPKT
jgi:hypothetical protein